MRTHLYNTALALILMVPTFATPVAYPANFETDPMLQVGNKEASSYAGSYKRGN
ncbi:uncharacterized protein F4817DRAFT_314182 [Daldinia loculata]|uniref:uncharacterized protein n=1 Tax=Daldinia loculata TaxID=103429 RepID=UPI0020C31614|nr:uncharacterized protein F4817DRAFT_314182 [Daldinia loculata]KAI1649240.1 hypothetical protein F4817DRAFT_314182 [Daldinia loculata]